MVEFAGQRGGPAWFTVDSDRLLDMMRKAPNKLFRNLRGAFGEIGIDWQRQMSERFTSYTGESSDNALQTRTGALKNSIKYKILPPAGSAGSIDKLRLLLLTGDGKAPYARIQEEGGTITPKSAKALTIPLDAARTSRGALSGKALIRGSAGKYYTDYGPTFIYRPKGSDNAFIAVRDKGDRLRLLYILKQKVVIPGPKTGKKSRLGAVRTAKFGVARAARASLKKAVDRTFEGKGGTA
jgi:hypothetical protein